MLTHAHCTSSIMCSSGGLFVSRLKSDRTHPVVLLHVYPSFIPSPQSLQKHTQNTLCRAKNTEHFVILQIIRCGSIGELSGTYHYEDLGDQGNDGKEKYFSSGVTRKHHLHVHVQRYRVWTKQIESKCLQNASGSQGMLEMSRIGC